MLLGAGLGPFCIDEFLTGESQSALVERTGGRAATIESIDGVPTLVVDGAPVRTSAFETYAPRGHDFEQFALAGTEVFGFSTNCAACDYGHSAPSWPNETTWNYSQFEQRAAMVLEAHPKAMLLPRVNLGTPRWWLSRNPDELERFDNGSTKPTGDHPTLPKDRARNSTRLLAGLRTGRSLA